MGNKIIEKFCQIVLMRSKQHQEVSNLLRKNELKAMITP